MQFYSEYSTTRNIDNQKLFKKNKNFRPKPKKYAKDSIEYFNSLKKTNRSTKLI